MDKFKGEELIEFIERFPTEESCLEYLAQIKWMHGFTCKKCGHNKFSTGDKHQRLCTRCKHIDSPTAGTLLHKVKFGVRKAFLIMFEMTATTKGFSASQIAKRYGITRKTAWMFMHKVRKGMESGLTSPILGTVHVDEFVVGGKETGKQGRSYNAKRKKVVCAVELTETDKVRRVYALQIEDFSSVSLRKIFDKHISTRAKVVTDEWKGYKPLTKDYNIEQIPSNNGQNFKQMHVVIHQIKSWIRTNFSWVHGGHIDKYLAEYSFRINRSIYKENIFHRIVERMMEREHVGYVLLKIATK